MPLKDIGKLGKDVNLINAFGNKKDIKKSIGNIGNDSFKKIRNSLDGLNVTEATDKLKNLSINPGLTADILESASSAKLLTGSTDEVSDAVKRLNAEAVQTAGTIGDAFNGAGNKIVSFFKSPTGILSAAIAIGAAVVALEDAFTVDYGEANEAASQSISAYKETKATLEDLNSEYGTTQARLTELQALKTSGSITLTEDIELEKLQASNTELARKIELQEKVLAIQERGAVADAKEAMSKKNQSVAQSIEAGDSKGKKNFKGIVGKTDDIGAVKENLALINDYEKKLPKLEKSIVEAKNKVQSEKDSGDSLGAWLEGFELDGAEKELKHYQDSINTLYSDLETRSTTMQSQLDTLKLDPDVNVSEIAELEKALNSITNIDLSPAEQALKGLDTYFDSSKGKGFIKDQLTEAAKSGKDLESVLNDMGLKLSDLGKGVTSDNLDRYFKEIANAAEDASNAVEKVNNNLTTDDIGEAFSSKNAGDDYVSMNDYLKKAKELYDQGLTGTDDFKSVAEAISYGIDSTSESFAHNYEKLQRYFTEDGDGNLTGQGMDNFLTDLQGLGKGYATWNAEASKWDINMDNTALAAKEMGVSVQTMEAVLGRIQDYDNLGDFNFRSAIQDFDDAKEALSGFDKLLEGKPDDDPLKKQVEGWKSQLDGWEQDLSTLDTDLVMKIKLEYDLATIQADIDETNTKIQESSKEEKGQHLTERNAGNQKYISTAESATGLKSEGVTVPVEYIAARDSIENLRKELSKDGLSKEEAVEIQMKIGNAQELQKDILDMFSDENPNINADSNVDEVNAAWESFYNTPRNLQVEGTLDTSTIESTLGGLTSGSTITFTADLNGVETEVQAVKNEDGTITYTVAGVNGELTEVQLSKNGTVSYKSDYSNTGTPPKKSGSAQYSGDYSGTGTPPTKSGSAQYSGDFNSVGSPPTLSGVINYVSNFIGGVKDALTGGSNGTSELNGTAHSRGTIGGLYPIPKLSGRALAHGSLDDDSWLKPQWKTKSADTSLTGELGQEIVVTGNRWHTVGDNGAEFASIPKGSVVFNARQTKELLSNGKINSRGSAHLSGTAYAGGANGSFNFGGGSGIFNKPNNYSPTPSRSNSNSGNSNNSNNANNSNNGNSQNVNKAADNAEKATEEVLDWIETLLNRVARQTEIAVDLIDDAIGLADKQSKTSSAMSKVQSEISTNRSAYDGYMSKANSVGLDGGYAQKVRDGSLNIETITDEDLKKKVSEYKEWYENAISCEDAIRDLQKQEKELALQRLENIEEYYDKLVEINETLQDVNEKTIELNTAQGNSAVSDNVKNWIQGSIKAEQDKYNNLTQKLVDSQAEFNDLLGKGYISNGDDKYLEYQATFNKLNEAILDSNISLIEFQDKLREVDYTKLQQAIDGFSRGYDRLKGLTDLKESRDEFVGRDDYQKQIDSVDNIIDSKYKLRSDKVKEQDKYDVGSERYQELADEISDIDNEITDSLIDIEELRDKVFEAEFFNFDKNIEDLDDFINEVDAFRKFLDEDAFFDKKGALTSEAFANIALVGQGISTEKQKIADYTAGIKKLDEMLKSGLISTTEYDERQKEFLEGIRDSAGAVDDYKNELLDLYKTQMENENEALKKNISLRQDAFNNMKRYNDYANSVKVQTKDVNALKAQISALEGINNISAQSELKRLKSQLFDAEDSLSQTKEDHRYDVLSEGFDKMSDDMDKILEDNLYEITHNSEKQEEIIKNMLNNVVNNYKDAYDKINGIIKDTGIIGSGDFNNTVTDIENGSSSIVNGATQTPPSSSNTNDINTDNTTNSEHSSIESELSKEPNTKNRLCAEITMSNSSISVEEGQSSSVKANIRPGDAANKTVSWVSSNSSVASVSGGTITTHQSGTAIITVVTTDGSALSATCSVNVTKKPTPPPPPTPPQNQTPSTPQGDGNPNMGDMITYASGNYTEDSYGAGKNGNYNLGGRAYITSLNHGSPKPYHLSLGSTLGSGDLGWVSLDQIRGYYTGGQNVNGLVRFDDTPSGGADFGSEMVATKSGVIGKLDGGTIFNKDQVRKLYEWTLNNDTLDMTSNIPVLNTTPADFKYKTRDTGVNVKINSLIGTVENVTKDSLPGLQEILRLAQENTTRHICKEFKKLR